MDYLQWDEFLARLDHNQVLARELAKDFLRSVDQRWKNYQAALHDEASSTRRLEHAAHALRGLLVPYGAGQAPQLLKKVEEEARKGRMSGLEREAELEDILQSLKNEIRTILGP